MANDELIEALEAARDMIEDMRETIDDHLGDDFPDIVRDSAALLTRLTAALAAQKGEG